MSSCYWCERAGHSASDRYHDNPVVNAHVADLMMIMTPNPFDAQRKPCPSIDDIVHTIAHFHGKRAADRVYIEVH
jgi:hypothetical protein